MASMSKIPSVTFLNVLDQYSLNSDLTCEFELSVDYQPRGRDCLAIFKLGWNHVSEYVATRGVPSIPEDRICSVTFDRHELPKNTLDLYQICYINGHDLYGASTPFQFCDQDDLQTISNEISNKSITSVDSLTRCQSLMEKDQEISRLRKENNILRLSLKTLLDSSTGSSATDYNKEIKEIKDLVESLKCILLGHDNDIKMFKKKIREGGEEYKKLYLEKVMIQKKYDKLKSNYNLNLNKSTEQKDQQPIYDLNFDLGDLKSIPPFPSIPKY